MVETLSGEQHGFEFTDGPRVNVSPSDHGSLTISGQMQRMMKTPESREFERKLDERLLPGGRGPGR